MNRCKREEEKWAEIRPLFVCGGQPDDRGDRYKKTNPVTKNVESAKFVTKWFAFWTKRLKALLYSPF